MGAPRYAYRVGVEPTSWLQHVAHALSVVGMVMTGALLLPATDYDVTDDVHACPFCSWAIPAHV